MGHVMFTFLLFISISYDEPLACRTDMLELNHFYDENGKLVFTQWIGWDWNDQLGTYVAQWYILKNQSHSVQFDGLVLRCNHYGKRYKIISKSFRETWTQYDPERFDYAIYNGDYRKGLLSLDGVQKFLCKSKDE